MCKLEVFAPVRLTTVRSTKGWKIYNRQAHPINRIISITTHKNNQPGDSVVLQDVRKLYTHSKSAKPSSTHNIPALLLKYGGPETEKIRDNYLPRDLEYKTVVESFHPVLDNNFFPFCFYLNFKINFVFMMNPSRAPGELTFERAA